MSDASGFVILPAIDLRGGRVVRLRQGDFDRETAYREDPVAVAREFGAAGARWIHLVDLDGARAGRPMQAAEIRVVIEAVRGRIRVEAAGGLRTADAATSMLDAGAARVVFGTAALADPAMVAGLIRAHGPERVAVAIDVRGGRAIGHGWVAGGADTLPAAEAIAALADQGVTTFEVTAVERDGLLVGPDFGLYERLVALDRGRVIASGGVSSLDDIRALRAAGCAGAILGRALYEGRLDLAEALQLAGEVAKD
jgi:phosphoribosylformimino-5-aminoimidazole carboxamide ribotide isomerase